MPMPLCFHRVYDQARDACGNDGFTQDIRRPVRHLPALGLWRSADRSVIGAVLRPTAAACSSSCTVSPALGSFRGICTVLRSQMAARPAIPVCHLDRSWPLHRSRHPDSLRRWMDLGVRPNRLIYPGARLFSRAGALHRPFGGEPSAGCFAGKSRRSLWNSAGFSADRSLLNRGWSSVRSRDSGCSLCRGGQLLCRGRFSGLRAIVGKPAHRSRRISRRSESRDRQPLSGACFPVVQIVDPGPPLGCGNRSTQPPLAFLADGEPLCGAPDNPLRPRTSDRGFSRSIDDANTTSAPYLSGPVLHGWGRILSALCSRGPSETCELLKRSAIRMRLCRGQKGCSVTLAFKPKIPLRLPCVSTAPLC